MRKAKLSCVPRVGRDPKRDCLRGRSRFAPGRYIQRMGLGRVTLPAVYAQAGVPLVPMKLYPVAWYGKYDTVGDIWNRVRSGIFCHMI